MGYAFISYSTKNQAEAAAMRDLLNRNGVKTWMAPGDIPLGNNTRRSLTTRCRTAAAWF